MPWAADTSVRIIAALELPMTTTDILVTVEGSMARTYAAAGRSSTATAESFVTAVEGYLDKIESLESQMTALAGSAGMIRADVVEWSKDGRTAGLADERRRLILRIARLLNISPGSAISGDGGKPPLVRS